MNAAAPIRATLDAPPRALGKSISILGATGSVGGATLSLIADARARHGDGAFPIEALTAGSNVEALAKACRQFRPRFAAIADVNAGAALKEALGGLDIAVGAGPDALVEAAQRPAEWVMAAIVGAAGLPPVLAAAGRGAQVALANKEALVCAGALVTRAAAQAGATLLPVDSEHNAIFQVLDPAHRPQVERLILTASGGPFRTWSLERMGAASPEEAVAHPNWSMGAKISVDSATMMNKGLELIEARHLFDMDGAHLDVLVHPQSVIHSLVEYADGSVLAQLGAPDMRVPIASALAWPERMMTGADRLDLAGLAQLTFEAPDETRFPCLSLARAALRLGDGATAALNAANEVAVARFLDRRIGFLDIHAIVQEAMDRHLAHTRQHGLDMDLAHVLDIDQTARREAAAAADRFGG